MLDSIPMAEDVMFQEAVEAIRQRQRSRARDLLTRLLRADQANPQYWLWMSSVVDTPKERIYCLQSVLRLDPSSRAARQGLVLLGASPPEPDLAPAPIIRRNWMAPVDEVPKPGGLKGLWANPVMRGIVVGVLGLLVLGLILGGVFGWGSKARLAAVAARRATATPGLAPTFTATPTFLGQEEIPTPQPTPTPSGPQPLWMLLKATYTSTPLYVQTPHAVSEAYRAAQRAYERADWENSLKFFQQASQIDPASPDIQFYIGEVERFMGDNQAALAAYDQAISINPNFGPAYLGRARARLAIKPKLSVLDDLKKAMDKDPGLGEAYLLRANLLLGQGDIKAALADLKTAERLLPNSPLVYLFRAQAELQGNNNTAALADAQRANQMDLTMLPGYLALGQAGIANQEYYSAVQALQTYVTYVTDNVEAWAALGHALYEQGQYSEAVTALDKALAIDDQLADAYLYRGLTELELGDGQPAVNDLVNARRFNSQAFMINLALGRALIVAERLNEARDVLTYSQSLAKTAPDQAAVYYWRAQVLESLGNLPAAKADWKALYNLPEEAVPAEWLAIAKQRLATTATPTITPTATKTPPKPTATPTTTLTPRTPSPSPTPKTPSPTPTSRTPSPTLTPKTPSPTPTSRTPSPTPIPKTPSPTPTSRTPSPTPRTPTPTVRP